MSTLLEDNFKKLYGMYMRLTYYFKEPNYPLISCTTKEFTQLFNKFITLIRKIINITHDDIGTQMTIYIGKENNNIILTISHLEKMVITVLDTINQVSLLVENMQKKLMVLLKDEISDTDIKDNCQNGLDKCNEFIHILNYSYNKVIEWDNTVVKTYNTQNVLLTEYDNPLYNEQLYNYDNSGIDYIIKEAEDTLNNDDWDFEFDTGTIPINKSLFNKSTIDLDFNDDVVVEESINFSKMSSVSSWKELCERLMIKNKHFYN